MENIHSTLIFTRKKVPKFWKLNHQKEEYNLFIRMVQLEQRLKALLLSNAPTKLSRNMVFFDLPLTLIYFMSIYFKIV